MTSIDDRQLQLESKRKAILQGLNRAMAGIDDILANLKANTVLVNQYLAAAERVGGMDKDVVEYKERIAKAEKGE